MTEIDSAALTATIERYVQALASRDADRILSYWDADEPEPFYIAEEIDDFILGHAAIHAYWSGNAGAMGRLIVRSWDHRFKLIGPDLVSGLFWMHWSAEIGRAPPLGGNVKVSALLRRVGGDWRLCQWVEAHLGPLPFLKRVYEQAADPALKPGH